MVSCRKKMRSEYMFLRCLLGRFGKNLINYGAQLSLAYESGHKKGHISLDLISLATLYTLVTSSQWFLDIAIRVACSAIGRQRHMDRLCFNGDPECLVAATCRIGEGLDSTYQTIVKLWNLIGKEHQSGVALVMP